MSKSREVTTDAVVIGRAQAGDGSARVFLYTEDMGLVSALAKSGREERSKLRPHLQVGTTGSFTLVRGREEWRVVGAVDTKNTHFASQGNQAAQHAAARVLGIVRQLVRGEDRNPELFLALRNFLAAAPSLDTAMVKAAEHVAVLRIVASLGYAPHTAHEPYGTFSSYDNVTLAHAHSHTRSIVRTINDALIASGLSA